jgi:ribonuclease HI
MPDTPLLPCPLAPGHLLIHTDGSCAGNLGPGGWAAVIRVTGADGTVGESTILTGHDPRTTNNRMEMVAAIEALRAFPEGVATIVTDSQYLIKGITEWVRPWKSRNWKNAAGAKVKNRDLWRELDALTSGRTIAWTWVKGHGGHTGNEEADQLASVAAKGMAKSNVADGA